MDASHQSSTRGDLTRAALVAAGIRIFGAQGFDAASLREITRAAGVNLAAVTYHFESKAGLHAACVEAVAAEMERDGPHAALAAGTEGAAPESRAAARRVLEGVVERALRDGFDPAKADRARFLQREILLDGRGAAQFVERVLGPSLDLLAGVIARAEDRPLDPVADRRRAYALIGATVFFNISREMAAAALGWRDPADHVPEMLAAILPPGDADEE